jgi:hypothetical protein
MKLGSSLAALAILMSAASDFAQAQPEAPPPAPAPEAVQVIAALDNACIPLIGGGQPRAVAKAAGMRINSDGDLYLSLPGGDKIIVTVPSKANPTNCAMSVIHDVGAGDGLRDGLAAWASHRPAPLAPEKVAVSSPEDNGISLIWTWVDYGAAKTEGLIFIEHKKADGSPLPGSHEQADVTLSIRPS